MKIYDTLLFDQELLLLEHRLAEIYDLVDVIVVVEAAETYQGAPKRLHFQENRERFQWAKEKLRPVTLPRLPQGSAWQREAFQRNAIQLGLFDAASDDVILILDADEIPGRTALQRLRRNGLDGPHRLVMTRHYGRLEMLAPRSACCPNQRDPFPFSVPHLYPGPWRIPGPDWHGSSGVAVRMRDIQGDTSAGYPARAPNELRIMTHFAPRLHDAGRHLIAITSTEDHRLKLSHVSHTELSDERALDEQHLARARRSGVHVRGWWYAEGPEGPLPEDLQRLKQRIGGSELRLPGHTTRRMVRTWGWMRHWPHLPESWVRYVDRHFERLTPFLAPLLLIADGIRACSAHWQNQDEAAPIGTH